MHRVKNWGYFEGKSFNSSAEYPDKNSPPYVSINIFSNEISPRSMLAVFVYTKCDVVQ